MIKDKILSKLINSKDYISGETLALEFNISRNAINKHIKKLRDLGWNIVSSTNKGYKILSHDKVIHPLLFKEEDFEIFKNLIILPTVDSTVKEGIRRVLDNQIKEPTIIISDLQEKGINQDLELFQSPKQLGIYLSICLKKEKELDSTYFCNKLLLAALNSLNKIVNVNLQASFPKGIFYRSKRYCSTLSYEVNNIERSSSYIILGLGIYTNYSFTNGLSNLKDICDYDIDRTQIIIDIIKNFEKTIKREVLND